MTSIYASHGIAAMPPQSGVKYLNLIDEGTFEHFLRSRSERFVGLSDALNSRGSCLTIDDSTVAAARGASMAKDLGHEVTLFINPSYVENNNLYHFARLNCLLDCLPRQTLSFDGTPYDFRILQDRLRLRLVVKDRLRRCSGELQQNEILDNLLGYFEMHDIPVPHFLSTIGKFELQILLRKGVRVENHGWLHIDSLGHSWSEMKDNILKGKSWLKSEFNIDTQYFAVPFGESLPHSHENNLYSVWFTLSSILNPGFVGPKIYNRRSLKLK